MKNLPLICLVIFASLLSVPLITVAQDCVQGGETITLHNGSGGNIFVSTADYIDCQSSDRGGPNGYNIMSGSPDLNHGGTSIITFSATGNGGPGVLKLSYNDGITSYEADITVPMNGNSMDYTLNGSVPPPTYTNYTICLQNSSLAGSATATWTFNGSVIKQELLPAGGSDCCTSPQIEVTPTPENVSFSGSVGGVGVNPAPLGDGKSGFTDPTLGGGSLNGSGGSVTPTANGTGSIATTGSTNTVTAGDNSPFVAPTNLVTFPASSDTANTGLATESSLKAGFSLLHGDSINLLKGESILNDSINGGFFSTTNILGQQVALLYSNVNIDGQWLPQIYAAITNLNFPTNITAALQTTNGITLNGSSNVFVQNWSTNYNQENTQIGISNLLAGTLGNTNDTLDTNDTSSPLTYTVASSDTNSDAANAAASTALGQGFNTAVTSASNVISGYLSQTIPDGSEPDFTISIPMAGVSFDANPVTQFPWFFLFAHALMTWITLCAFATGVLKTVYDILQAYAAAQTGGVPNLTGGSGGTSGTISEA